jgi:AAA+ superfamily predicted ATPase
MARSDLLIGLVRAGASGNQPLFKQTVEALIAEERGKQHFVLAENLARLLAQPSVSRTPAAYGAFENKVNGFLLEASPQRKLEDLILDKQTRELCGELIEEHQRADLLRSFNLEPRNKILLVGPPGNGKTSLAEALAESLMVPLLTVRYHAVIGSFLGETAMRLKNMFDHVRSRRCVLFLDEFETLAKERGDIHETGEIKRVVSSLLLEMDALPSYVVIVTATNHPELLDRAVWRRFQIRISLAKPGRAEVQQWIRRFEKQAKLSLGLPITNLSRTLAGLSFAELEEFGNDVLRKHVLASPGSKKNESVTNSLVQWRRRAEAMRNKKSRNGR